MMEKDWKDMTLAEFSEELASSSPTPGGGGACAYVAALGVALGRMVAALTTGKEKYAETQGELDEIIERLKDNQEKMINGIEEDAKGFLPLAEAFALPRGTQAEIQHREMMIEACLIDAAKSPLNLMRSIVPIVLDLERLADIGSVLAVSDAGSGVIFCKAAADAAILNVNINTKLMSDKMKAMSMNQEAKALQNEITAISEDALRIVSRKVKK